MRLKVTLHEDLGAALMDGVVLCHLANHIRPRSVASIHVPSPAVVSKARERETGIRQALFAWSCWLKMLVGSPGVCMEPFHWASYNQKNGVKQGVGESSTFSKGRLLKNVWERQKITVSGVESKEVMNQYAGLRP